jgi:hypothetical protein
LLFILIIDGRSKINKMETKVDLDLFSSEVAFIKAILKEYKPRNRAEEKQKQQILDLLKTD